MKTNFFAILFFATNSFGSQLAAQQIEKTEILILGTPHLNSLGEVTNVHLSRLIDSLSLYQFDVIAIEQMPPELLLDIKSRSAQHWQELYSSFSGSFELGKQYQKILELEYESAIELVDSLLCKNPLTETDRVQLMNAALCSYDIWTASLNYQYIKDKSKLDTSICNLLNGYNKSSNELNLIGVNLAKRLNLSKLYYIDDLQDETILINDYPSFFSDYSNSLMQINELLSEAKIFGEVSQLTVESIKSMDLFPLYKFLNSERYMNEDYAGQWELWLKTDFDSKTDRSRFSLWEMRNLKIAANIMRLVAKFPEKKILVVIGASHKLFIEKYLREMPDIQLLDF